MLGDQEFQEYFIFTLNKYQNSISTLHNTNSGNGASFWTHGNGNTEWDGQTDVEVEIDTYVCAKPTFYNFQALKP